MHTQSNFSFESSISFTFSVRLLVFRNPLLEPCLEDSPFSWEMSFFSLEGDGAGGSSESEESEHLLLLLY